LVEKTYLFGSAARGEMEKESDIDLFFDFGSEEEKKEAM
jgi:predicted nucleotidyltransferase